VAKLIALYRHPKDAKAFDRHYHDMHIPLAKKIPGLKKFDISDGVIGTPEGASPYHLAATLFFDSKADILAALSSPEGQATAADVGTFADGGVELLIFDTKEV
jgi:uncharacterized protein (TIGR02118 family)